MKTWEKIMLYPIGLYIWLTDGIMKMSKKWKPAMAMMMAVVMLCGMLPATAIAGTNDDEADLLERLGVEGEVQLAELDGGKYIAVYLDDDDSRDSYNNQAAYYAIYDGVWQRPYILEDDGTKDYMPTISDLGNGQLFIAWGTANKTFDANTKEYAALNATDIVGVFVDKATGNISEVLEVTYETEDDDYGDENPRAAYDEATGRLMIWYNKCVYSDVSDPYFVLSYRLYDMRVTEFLDEGDSPDGDWYGQVLVGVDPAVTVEETLDASGYWAETPEFTGFEGWSCAVEFDAIQFNGQSLLAYAIDYDLNRSTTDDRDVYVLAYNFDDNSIIHPIMITNTDAAESNVEFRDVDGKLCLSYLSDGQEITFNISDNFSNANVLREGVTDDGAFYYYISKSADSGYIPATVAAKHTVSFAANEGSGSMTPVEVEDGTEYTLPACTFTAPSNKTFKAWSVGGEEKQPGDKITISADTTVAAVWEILHTCSITPVEKVWPDCENGGKEAYYKCEGCGKFFEDANGTTEIADIANWGNLPKNDHDYGTLKAAQPEIHTATELKAGVAAHYFCDECDTYFTEDKVATDLDALTGTVPSHNYATVNGYKGEDGHADTCACGAKDTVVAHTPNIAAPTENDDQICSVCEYVIAPKLGHIHQNNLTKVPAQGADCENDGNIEYYTCTCGKWFADATASVEITDKDSVAIKGGHKYGTDWKSDKNNHWNECACGDKANTAAHKDENADGKCDVCEYNVGLPTTPNDGNNPSDNPQTGDNSVIHLWIMLLCMSAMGIVALTVFSKKKSVR